MCPHFSKHPYFLNYYISYILTFNNVLTNGRLKVTEAGLWSVGHTAGQTTIMWLRRMRLFLTNRALLVFFSGQIKVEFWCSHNKTKARRPWWDEKSGKHCTFWKLIIEIKDKSPRLVHTVTVCPHRAELRWSSGLFSCSEQQIRVLVWSQQQRSRSVL